MPLKNLIYIVLLAFLPILATAGSDEKASNYRKTISGKITDTYGEAIPGVRIVVKESGQEFFADFEGKFNISLPADSNLHLLVETIGYKPVEIKSLELGLYSELSLKSL